MQCSRSSSRLIETAFVSQLPSSLEDLDEVDRLANHPVLRPYSTSSCGKLRKSRSEMGGSVGKGLSVWGHGGETSSGRSFSKSGQNSPVTPSHFGCRTVGVAMLIKSGKWYKSSQSSANLQTARSPSGSSPLMMCNSNTPTQISEDHTRNLIDHNKIKTRHHVVTAVIESSNRRTCITPPADLRSHSKPKDLCPSTPPNTAPLPVKFGRVAEPSCVASPPQNLLGRQLKRGDDMTDVSSNVTTSSITRRLADSDQDAMASSPLSPPKYRLPVAMVNRLHLEKKCEGSASGSSSADSTPHRKVSLSQKPILALAKSNYSKTPVGDENASTFDGSQIQTSPRANNNLVGCRLAKPSLQPKRPSMLCPSTATTVTKKMPPSKFFMFESESCSSAVSSLDSVCSGSSEGLVSSHSDLTTANPTSARPQVPPKMLIAKFQVLSPISDKSQEQSSEQGDSCKTPKISPTDHILACCGGTTVAQDESNGDGNNIYTKNIQININNNNNCSNSSNNNLEPAPFSMPKLQRRLKEQQQIERRREAAAAHGSDSGISMASQDVLDIYELLQLPFDMPKLRRKTKQMIGNARPQSVPNRNQSFMDMAPCSLPLCQPVHTSQDSTGNQLVSQSDNLNILTSKASVRTALNLNSFSAYQQSAESSNKTKLLLNTEEVGPPPPPGFVDDTSQYYLPENLNDDERTSDHEESRPPQIVQRRNRPQMTLSFGTNTAKKTLMFATNSPFALNSCVEINPNLPLDRQDWYHGAISRSEAESILKQEKEGSYLVRNVDSSRQEFALSLKSARGYMHMRIRRDPLNRDFQLSDFERRFITIPEMVHHYTRNRLPIKGAEHMCLIQPVAYSLL